MLQPPDTSRMESGEVDRGKDVSFDCAMILTEVGSLKMASCPLVNPPFVRRGSLMF